MIENIVAGIIATLICSTIFKVLEVIKNRKKDEPNIKTKDGKVTLRDISIARKQFFICLNYLIIVAIALMLDIIVYDFLLTFILVTVFFTFLLLWGSFDAIFYPLKRFIGNKENQSPNKDSYRNE
ncbi:MAG: hypothetical protein ACFWT6_12190 [Virgibacillus proomii]